MIGLKRQTRTLLALITLLVTVISLIPTTAGAANVGDVVAYAQPTDIIATINGYQLQSYNVYGYTYICAEDLRYYGFDVNFDYATRALSIVRNSSNSIDPQNQNPNFWLIGSKKTNTNILHTDIVTYVDNSYVASNNIDGKTIINFNELARFGNVNYDNNRREISLELAGVNKNLVAQLAVEHEKIYGFNENWKCVARAKGSVLLLSYTYKDVLEQSVVDSIRGEYTEHSKEMARNFLVEYKTKKWPVTSVYVEMLNKDGGLIASYQAY